jgi:START domain
MQNFFLLFLFFISEICAHSQHGWELQKDKNGLKIFTRETDSSKFKAIKVECILDGNLSKFNAIIRDVDNHKNWIYSTKKSYLLKRISNNEILYYTETFLPWPLSNRDVVIKMDISVDSTANAETINTYNVNGVVDKKEDIVRVLHLSTQWQVKTAGINKISIVYYFATDPGGSLPAWIVNAFAVKGPYETFTNLAELLKQN